MVIDSSAIVAILFQESDAAHFSAAIERWPTRKMSMGTYLEIAIVAEGRSRNAGTLDFDQLIRSARVELVPFDLDQARIAREAYRRFGKGNHRAGLNFGDCFAYALAKFSGEPLLFKGTDFAQTDVKAAI
jgi:ribonuclease VapC